MKAVGVKVEHGEELKEGSYKGTYTTMGDKEHSQIIELYASGLGYMAVAAKVKRSSRTAKNQVDSHNLAIQRSGFCPSCKRVASEHYNKVVLKGS